MTDQDPDITGEDGAEAAAAEHVLRLLQGDEAASAEARARNDPAFRAKVEAWERRLAPLTDNVAPVTPPTAVWGRIAGSIGAPASVVVFPTRARWLDKVGVWRAATGASLLAAAACLALVLLPPKSATAPAGDLVATLATPDGKALFVATLDPSQNHLTVIPVSAVEAPGRSPELWIIPQGGKPRPVGLIQVARALTVPASSAVAALAAPDAILAVSLEPPGGSPTGAPTGPVIATGPLKAV